jgi:hypothetical protein
MSHFFAFLKQYPATFNDVQSTIERLKLPLRLNCDRKFETSFSLQVELGENSALLSMELINVCDLPTFFGRPQIGDRALAVDFRYGEDWADACSSLIFCYALATDFDAKIYDDYMDTGFVTMEKARDAIDSWLADN